MTALGDRRLGALDDLQLAARCAGGDVDGWDELLARFDRRVLLVLLRAGAPAHELADLRQEVFARLLEENGAALRGLRGEREGALGAYVARVALRVAIDHGRARGSRQRQEAPEEEAHQLSAQRASPEEIAQLNQGRARFGRALLAAATGPQLERDLIVLRAHFLDGLNPQEIAAMGVGLSTKGVETLLRRSRLQIEAELVSGAGGARGVVEKQDGAEHQEGAEKKEQVKEK